MQKLQLYIGFIYFLPDTVYKQMSMFWTTEYASSYYQMMIFSAQLNNSIQEKGSHEVQFT